jgi:hypothetical protein
MYQSEKVTHAHHSPAIDLTAEKFLQHIAKRVTDAKVFGHYTTFRGR